MYFFVKFEWACGNVRCTGPGDKMGSGNNTKELSKVDTRCSVAIVQARMLLSCDEFCLRSLLPNSKMTIHLWAGEACSFKKSSINLVEPIAASVLLVCKEVSKRPPLHR